jgi:hypothetical protein
MEASRGPVPARSRSVGSGRCRRLVYFLALQALVGGCAQGLLQPPPAVPAGSAATVTITRKSSMVGAAGSKIIAIDDRDVVALRSGDQHTIPVEAGWRTIGVRCPGEARTPARRSLDERLEAGEHYDFWVEVDVDCATIRKLGAGELPALELSLSLRTLAEVEVRLLGDSGLLKLSRGTRPIEAGFKGLALTGPEILRLSTLIREALASPAGSEVELTGTIDGATFRAAMDKNREGRARVRFEGLRFKDDQEMRAFVAPLETETLKEFTLEGSVAGRRIHVKR